MVPRANLNLVIVAALGLLILCGSAWAIEANDLAAYWKFDEGTGTTAYDAVGDNDGTLNGDPNWTAGQFDGALAFDGADDYVYLPNNAVTTTEFTLSAWANPYGPGGGAMAQNVIFCQRDNPAGDNHSLVFLATEVYDYSPYASAIIRSSSGPRQILHHPMKDYNQWHHYAMTVSSSDFIFYIDGIEVNRTTNIQAGNYVTSIDQVYIGKHWYFGRTEGLFNGAIDEVMIFNRALSAEEIQQLYWDGLDRYELAVMHIEDAIAEKAEALAKIDAALEREWTAYEELEKLLESGDYGDLSKHDIVKARQQIHSAIQRQQQSEKTLKESIEKLEYSLNVLGYAVEPDTTNDR